MTSAGIRRVFAGRRQAALAVAPVLLLIVVVSVWGALDGELKDLRVYQFSGRALLDGVPLYESGVPATGLPFTYPPFAAVVMVPLSMLPWRVAAALMTGVSVAALAAVVALVRRELSSHATGWQVALLSSGALALEPVWQNLAFGQVNLLLMMAVLLDLMRPHRRWSGVLVGVAAGIKLTPLAFVLLLVVVGCRPAARRALLTWVATAAIGFIAAPASSVTYWTDGLVDASRVGPPALAHNQSVYGALTRLLDRPPPSLLWLAIAGLSSLAALVTSAAWWRRGDRLLGICLAAMAMLLASPVSWSHHWVWAVPVALVLWERRRMAAIAWTAVFVARPIVWPPYGQNREYAWSASEHVVGNAYLLVAVALITYAAWTRPRSHHEAALSTDRSAAVAGGSGG